MESYVKQFTATLLLVMAALAGFNVQANPLEAELQTFCEKTKQCAIKQLSQEQDIPAEMRDMINKSLERMCDGIMTQYGLEGAAQQGASKQQIADAKACLKSLNKLNCEQLNQIDQTPECKKIQ